MEIPGYTENEKEHIAREHLIPKQMEINGIPEGKLVIQPAALGKLINNYTKEAGVRSLERSIGRICRKTARAIMEEGKDKVVVTSRNISRFLGKERYNYLMAISSSGLADTRASTRSVPISSALLFPN